MRSHRPSLRSLSWAASLSLATCAVALAGGAAAGPALAGTSTSGTPTAAPVPAATGAAGPLLLGVVGGQVPQAKTSRLTAFQSQAGRTMATVRMYALWDSAWPDTLSSYAKAHGQTVVLSVKTKHADGSPVSWRGIADSQPGDAYDATIVRWANAIKAFGAPVMFTLNHEPEVYKSDAMGGPADYVAAWRHVVQVFQQQGVTNVEWVWISTAFGYKQSARAAPAFYPGDDWVDDLAVDGYNWYDCRPKAHIPWASPAELFGPFHDFALQHPTKGVLIAEFGTVEDPALPGRKAQWFSDLKTMLQSPSWSQVRGAAEWYQAGDPGACNWQIDTSPSALATFQAWGQDPQWGGAAVPPATVRQVSASRTSGRSVAVRWAPAGPGGARVASYTVTVAETGQSYAVGGASRSFTWTAPTSGTYTFRVSATNRAGTNQPSRPASVSLAAR